MNYIISQIDKKILYHKSLGSSGHLKVHYQSKFEFYLIHLLSFFWNKNFFEVSDADREYVVNCIMKPSVGTIISLIRRLDINGTIFKNKSLKRIEQKINNYPKFRNERIGHGYSFEDDIKNYIDFFEDLFKTINDLNVPVITDDLDLILVNQVDLLQFYGIRYSHDGNSYTSWSCPKAKKEFEIGDIYCLTKEGEYVRLSPFIHLTDEEEFYIFVEIEEKLLGRTKYNRLLKTGNISKDNKEFEKLSISIDKIKRRSANGTIVNVFDNNYNKYIDVGITNSILKFLRDNKSSVFATIWGHGGVGKTASIQRVIEIIANQEVKIFDYAIFISAKDRYYNYYKGMVVNSSNAITTLSDIITNINNIVYADSSDDPRYIFNYSGKMLIVIDDYETFNKQEKENVISFIGDLDINHHKLILTTRSATLITGQEIQTKELTIHETKLFFVESFKNEFPSFPINLIEEEIGDNEIQKEIFRITSGRPLFILQLVIFSAEKGSIKNALSVEINRTKQAINFLYDRLYDYLSMSAKNMFLAISLFVSEDDLSGVTEHLKFVLNLENKPDDFNNALNELIKLKIIKLEDRDFYKVYSPDIYDLMKKYYQYKGGEYDGNITSRFNLINSEENLSIDVALLKNADASRTFETEAEVENKYRYILNKENVAYTIRIKALQNFASYLSANKGKPDKAIKQLRDYKHIFGNDKDYIFMYSSISWSLGTYDSRRETIEIIQNYLLSKPKLNSEIYLEFISLLMMYSGIRIMEVRDILKAKMDYGGLSKQVFDSEYKKQKEEMFRIFKFPGLRLYDMMKKIHLADLKPRTRNTVLDGLIQFIEILIRTFKFQYAIDICDKVETELTSDYHRPFSIRRSRILSMNKVKIQKIPTGALTNSQQTLLGTRLEEAFFSKKDSLNDAIEE